LLGLVVGRTIPPDGEIDLVWVRPDRRRRGIGVQLVEHWMAWSADRGVEVVTLEVASRNRAAQQLYQGLGFRRVGVRRAYYGDDDAWVLQFRGTDRGAPRLSDD
jgi:ribosomal-protein-alanine N-acetyltransferase